MSTRYEEALTDVGKVYGHPQELCDDSSLTPKQKIKLLKQWEYDLRDMQVAAEENMQGPGVGQTGELLRTVRKCLSKLGADDDLEQGGPSKQGG